MTLATQLATGFGIGRIPVAPGTAASLIALPLGWTLIGLGMIGLPLGVLAVSVIGVWAAGAHGRAVRIHDPSDCVIDELAGQWIAVAPIAFDMRGSEWGPFVVAFLLFRLFDIMKPWPIVAAERLPGGYGVMADDIVAGIAAALVLYGLIFIGWV